MAAWTSSAYLFVVLVWLNAVILTEGSLTTNGSTLHLKDIVLGRCSYYQQFKMPNLSTTSNCTAIWKAFHAGFAFKDPCKLTFADYEPFFDLVKGGNIADKSLFWSGLKPTVHYYSYFDLRYTTLEDTFTGSMVDGLQWCGNPSLPRNSSDGIDYESCPKCRAYSDAFWGQASRKFAERVSGVVRVMLNGTRKDKFGKWIPAYERKSFFGKFELPNLKVNVITKLLIIVVHTIDQPSLEQCGTKTIQILKEDAEALGLTVKCKNDPDDVKHVLCIDKPETEECKFQGKSNNGPWMITAIVFIVLSVLLLGMLIAVCWLYKRRLN